MQTWHQCYCLIHCEITNTTIKLFSHLFHFHFHSFFFLFFLFFFLFGFIYFLLRSFFIITDIFIGLLFVHYYFNSFGQIFENDKKEPNFVFLSNLYALFEYVHFISIFYFLEFSFSDLNSDQYINFD